MRRPFVVWWSRAGRWHGAVLCALEKMYLVSFIRGVDLYSILGRNIGDPVGLYVRTSELSGPWDVGI